MRCAWPSRQTDFVCALPQHFAAQYAAGFDVVSLDAPLPLGGFRLIAVAPRAAMMDVGLAWLLDRDDRRA